MVAFLPGQCCCSSRLVRHQEVSLHNKRYANKSCSDMVVVRIISIVIACILELHNVVMSVSAHCLSVTCIALGVLHPWSVPLEEKVPLASPAVI